MKNRYLLVVIVVICSIFSCSKPNIKSLHIEDKGVSLELAQYRQEQVKDVAYKLFFAIPEQEEEVITAQLQLQLKIEDLTLPLYLDFKEDKSAIKAINVNGQASIIEHKKEHLIIAKELLNKGVNTIVIDFEAGELSLNRNEDYLYTLLVPDRARTLFPCFDQPDIKAVYELIIKAPQQWQVLCGAPLKFKETKEGATTYHFEKSDKMSTYLFSFVAGRFDYISSQNTQQEMKMLYRETDTDKITSSITPIFDLHQKSLDFLETYTDVKYPFKKMDFAVIPGFQYGGMEHTGAIQYRESTLFLDQSATKSQELARAKLIAHETSHMWFGNLVTMEWFNDVWMKEVFANFMADKIVNPVFETVNHDLKFLTIHYPSAYSVDRTQGTNPIRQELNNLANAGSLYGRIIYNKSPIMMRQLEQALGEDRFKEGIRSYIKTYANGNTDWDGLINILD